MEEDGAFQFSVGSDIDEAELEGFLKGKAFKFPSEAVARTAGKKFCGFARLLRLRCQVRSRSPPCTLASVGWVDRGHGRRVM